MTRIFKSCLNQDFLDYEDLQGDFWSESRIFSDLADDADLRWQGIRCMLGGFIFC